MCKDRKIGSRFETGQIHRSSFESIMTSANHRLNNLPTTTVIILLLVIVLGTFHPSIADFVDEHYFGKFAGSLLDVRDQSLRNIGDDGVGDISGDVYFVNKQTIFLYNFSFSDGHGTEVYFKVGSSGRPDRNNGLIIPDELGSYHKLGKYSKQNLLLTLPKGISVNRLRWFSLWSKTFWKSLGELLLTQPVSAPETQSLGPLVLTKDSVNAKNVLAIDDKTILIRKMYYTVHCFYCGFFVGTGSGPNSYGIRIPDENASFAKLRNYYNEDIILRLPRDLSLIYLDWLAIYDPEQKKSYGFVRVPKPLNVPPNMAFMLTYVTLFPNCEAVLPGLMHVSWKIHHPDIYIQLEARVASNQYAAFGLSGSLTQSKMIGSDVFVTYYDADTNKVVLEDYTLTAKTQCNVQSKRGVCSDTMIGGSNDLELLMSSYIDGLIKATFRRPLKTRDRFNDLPFILYDDSHSNYVVAAIGTLDMYKNPSYHTVALNTKHHHQAQTKHRPINVIDFGRPKPRRNTCEENLWQKVINQPANIFNTIANSQRSEMEIIYDLKPWKPAMIKTTNNHVFHVVIGPAGNPQQGYTSITGNESPTGKAIWINDLLIPEIQAIRGHDYTFLIETGDNKSDPKRYYPFYITDSREGGEALQSKLYNSSSNRIYAGVVFREDGSVDPKPGTGRYCELVETSANVDPAFIYSIEDYRKTLRLQCQKGNVGSFRWRPDHNTPDVVYYQSFTQKNMGWKIKVTSGANPVRFLFSLLLSSFVLLVQFCILIY